MTDTDAVPAPRKRTPFDEFRLRVSAAPLEQGAKPPSLKFDVYQNNANFRMYSNVGESKPLYCGMDLYSYLALLNLLAKFSADQMGDESHRDMVCRTGKPHEMRVAGKMRVGKDEKNAIYIALLAEGETPVKFIFGPSNYHDVLDSRGEPCSQAEVSRTFANVYVNVASKLVLQQISLHPAQEQPNFGGDAKKPWQGNQGGQKPWQGNNGGGGQKPWQKKPWQGNSNNGGGGQKPWQKKPWQGNNGGGQKKPWQGNNDGGQKSWGGNNNSQQGDGLPM